MKADAKFSRYSEREWRAIDAEVARASSSADKIGLKERLERLGRDYVSAPTPTNVLEQLKFFAAQAKQAAEFRRWVIETGPLPPELQRQAAEAAGEIEQFWQDRAIRLGTDHGLRQKRIEAGPNYCRIQFASPPRSQNAQLAALDRYFESLLDVWMGIGGHWPGSSNTKAITAFVAACSRPVVGPKSTTTRAISERLYRLDRRRCSGYAKET